MPSAQVLESKKELVGSLTEKLKKSVAGVVVDYKGISVDEDTKLRKAFREENVEYFVVKNTMLRFAAKEAGLDGIIPSLEGTTAIALSESDVVAPAKVASKFAKQFTNYFNIKTGFMDGAVMEVKDIDALGNLPSREQLLTQLAVALSGNVRGLAVALNAIAEQKESA